MSSASTLTVAISKKIQGMRYVISKVDTLEKFANMKRIISVTLMTQDGIQKYYLVSNLWNDIMDFIKLM